MRPCYLPFRYCSRRGSLVSSFGFFAFFGLTIGCALLRAFVFFGRRGSGARAASLTTGWTGLKRRKASAPPIRSASTSASNPNVIVLTPNTASSQRNAGRCHLGSPTGNGLCEGRYPLTPTTRGPSRERLIHVKNAAKQHQHLWPQITFASKGAVRLHWMQLSGFRVHVAKCKLPTDSGG